MTALPERKYRDPLHVLLRDEEESCKGCRYRTTDRDGVTRCKNPRQRQVLAEKRCDEYRENK